MKCRRLVLAGLEIRLADFVTLSARAGTTSEAHALLDITEADLRVALRTVDVEILGVEDHS